MDRRRRLRLRRKTRTRSIARGKPRTTSEPILSMTCHRLPLLVSQTANGETWQATSSATISRQRTLRRSTGSGIPSLFHQEQRVRSLSRSCPGFLEHTQSVPRWNPSLWLRQWPCPYFRSRNPMENQQRETMPHAWGEDFWPGSLEMSMGSCRNVEQSRSTYIRALTNVQRPRTRRAPGVVSRSWCSLAMFVAHWECFLKPLLEVYTHCQHKLKSMESSARCLTFWRANILKRRSQCTQMPWWTARLVDPFHSTQCCLRRSMETPFARLHYVPKDRQVHPGSTPKAGAAFARLSMVHQHLSAMLLQQQRATSALSTLIPHPCMRWLHAASSHSTRILVCGLSVYAKQRGESLARPFPACCTTTYELLQAPSNCVQANLQVGKQQCTHSRMFFRLWTPRRLCWSMRLTISTKSTDSWHSGTYRFSAHLYPASLSTSIEPMLPCLLVGKLSTLARERSREILWPWRYLPLQYGHSSIDSPRPRRLKSGLPMMLPAVESSMWYECVGTCSFAMGLFLAIMSTPSSSGFSSRPTAFRKRPPSSQTPA